MVFAGPLELAPTAAISNWFVRRRAFVLALFGVTQGTGLAAMPFIAQLLITGWGWRSAWTALGVYTLAVGVVPALVLMARRPEDMGFEPDPAATRRRRRVRASAGHGPDTAPSVAIGAGPESHFTLAQALRTRALWVLSVFSAAGFMVQAGVSLHQVSHYIDQGLPASAAALSASVFAFAQVPAGLLWSALVRRLPVRVLLALSGLAVALGTVGTALSGALASALLSTSMFGIGVGGLHFLLRLAWADYYGRQHIGTIRGITLPVQIGGQAIGPVAAGAVFDLTGGYHGAFVFFAGAVALASLLVLTAVPPRSS
jgi:sugar phosphate permease